MAWRVLLGFTAALAVLVLASFFQSRPFNITYRNLSDTRSGFVGEFTVTNLEKTDITDWVLAFDLAPEITHLWGAKIVSHSGKRYVIRAEPWNRRIPPGETILIGFKGQPGGARPRRIGFKVPNDPDYFPPGPDHLPTTETKTPKRPEPPVLIKPTFTVTKDWGTGFMADISLTNNGWKPVRSWVFFLELPRAIRHIAGAQFTARAGGKYRFDAPLYGSNAIIPPRGQIHLQILARPGNFSAEPTTMFATGLVSPYTGGRFNYAEALQKSLYFYEAQRSGKLPTSNRVGWRGDSALDDGYEVGVDLSGGYYDAGDHVKFGLPLCSALTMLSWGGIQYGEGYRMSGQWNTLLDTVRWGTDWLLKAHTKQDELYGQVGEGTIDHEYWGSAEKMTMPRTAFKIDADHPGSDLAGEASAALAAASLLFREEDPVYAEKLLEHARQLYDFAENCRGKYSDAIPDAKNFYQSISGYEDELVWAALWLHAATGEPGYLITAETRYGEWLQGDPIDRTQTWDDKRYGCAVLLALTTKRDTYKREVESFLDFWTGMARENRILTTPGGLAWLDHWGSLRYAANTAFLAFVYSDTVSDYGNVYHRFAKRQINYILGDNPRRSSYMVGFGRNPPMNPHHRGAHGSTDGSMDYPVQNTHILYGAMVGGPSHPDDFAFADDRSDLHTNEVALDYNAGLSGALARMVMLYGGKPQDNFPPPPVPELPLPTPVATPTPESTPEPALSSTPEPAVTPAPDVTPLPAKTPEALEND